MARFAAKDHVVKMAREAAHLSDLRSKYICAYLDAVGGDGIMRYGLHQLRNDDGGTVSGRYSSSAMTRDARSGINVQQVMAISKQKRLHGDKYLIRELYIPALGHLLLAADAKQIEFRIFVHLSRSERLVKQYRDNPETDFHLMVAEMVQRLRPDFDRKRVKNLNFEQLYGGGMAKTAEMLGCTEQEARRFVSSYDRAFPEARKLLKEASRVAESRGYVKTLMGRRTRFPDKKRLHKALNGAIQGGAADVNKVKVAELYEVRKSLGLTLRMTVHDEVVGDVPDQEAARKVAEVLDQQSLSLLVPILWDTKTGANWAVCA
jgi:DNA polymerase I-like protein with 3'-5' exonuclease and polymerase domains